MLALIPAVHGRVYDPWYPKAYLVLGLRFGGLKWAGKDGKLDIL